jgi:hypothetical protein
MIASSVKRDMSRRVNVSVSGGYYGPRIAVLLGTVMLALCCRARAQPAQHVRLEWKVPAGCPTRDAVLMAINRQLGNSFQTDTELRASAEIKEVGPEAFTLAIDYALAGQPAERREVPAESCRAAADAAALLIAVALSPQEAAPATPPAAAAPKAGGEANERAMQVRFEIAALGTLDTAIMPHVGAGAAVRLALGLDGFVLDLTPRVWASQRAEHAPASANVKAWAVELGVCYLLTLSSLQAGPCGRVEIGQLAANATGVDAATSGNARLQAMSLSLQVRSAVFPWLWLLLDAGADWIERRPQFVVDGIGTIHHPSTFGARLFLGPALIW